MEDVKRDLRKIFHPEEDSDEEEDPTASPAQKTENQSAVEGGRGRGNKTHINVCVKATTNLHTSQEVSKYVSK